MAENIIEALAAIQAEALEPVKSGTNPHFGSSYVTLESLLALLHPVLDKNEVVLIQQLTDIEGRPALSTQLVHVPTQNAIESRTPMVFTKEDPQAVGSAITYYRRYALMALFGFAGVDDDGNAAAGGSTKAKPKAAPKRGARQSGSSAAAEAIEADAAALGGDLF